MTREENAALVLQPILDAEGGIKDIGDGAGLTRFGQTPAWLMRFGFRPPESRADALANYLTFLNRTGLLGVCDYPDVFAHAVIDWAINSDHPIAIAGVQRALRVDLAGLKVDGIFGPETQSAVDACDRRRAAAAVVAEHARYYGLITTKNPAKNAQWSHGWMNRLAKQIEVLAD